MNHLKDVLLETEPEGGLLAGESVVVPSESDRWWVEFAAGRATSGRGAVQRRERAERARENLITHFAPLVNRVASRMIVRLPDTVELGDLVSYGMFGLIDAVEKFEPERGYKFETYAATRVRGAIIDELRATDWVPRSVRSKARTVEAATRMLEQRLLRRVNDEDVAAHLAWKADEVRTVRAQVALSHVAALEGMADSGRYPDGEPRAESLQTPGAGAEMDRQETLLLLSQAIHSVRERDREMLRLYYFENLTLGQIGRILGVTESRVSQIHTAAVGKLRETLVRTGAFG